MKLSNMLLSVVLFSFVSGSALAADTDKASKQAEVRKAAHASLERFYKAKPALKGEVAKAPGYAVFTTFGVSFLIGGAGGSGLAHDNATKKDTYMSMAQASAGLQAGVAQSETLIVFKSKEALAKFIDKGWEYSGGGVAGAGVDDKSVSAGTGEQIIAEALYWTLTKNGLQAGAALAGTKFWKNEELN